MQSGGQLSIREYLQVTNSNILRAGNDILAPNLATLVFLITDQVPNNHPGYQNSGFSGAMALLII